MADRDRLLPIRPTDSHVGKRIRMRRLAMKMSQAELGHRLGITGMAVCKYEKGEIRIGASRLQEIADVLRVTPAFFFEAMATAKARAPSWPDYVTEFLATPDGLALAKAFADVKDATFRRRIIRLVIGIVTAVQGRKGGTRPRVRAERASSHVSRLQVRT